MICTAFGDGSLTVTTVFKYHSRLKVDRHLLEDDKYSGRPDDSKTDDNECGINWKTHSKRSSSNDSRTRKEWESLWNFPRNFDEEI